jgi:hypothetical protein
MSIVQSPTFSTKVKSSRLIAIREVFLDSISFLAPSLLFVEFHLGGRLLLTEVVLLAVLPVLVIQKGYRLLTREPQLILGLGLLWLFCQILTDLIRSTPFEDLARGWSKIAFALLNFATIYLLVGENRKRLVGFALGMCSGWFLTYLINPSAAAIDDPWKFGLGIPVSVLGLVLASIWPLCRIRLAQMSVAIGLGIFHFLMAARNYGGICFLTGVFMIFQLFFARKDAPPRRITLLQFSSFGIITFCFIMLTYSTYSYMALHGWMGEDARRKYEVQSSGAFGVLLGGRAESLASINAVMDSPIIGHGSWAKDSRYIDYLYKLYDLGYDSSSIIEEYMNQGIIPTHSYIMGAWVDAGVMGALFWAVVFLRIPPLLYRLASVNEPLTPIMSYLCFRLAWDILFSPFGQAARVPTAYTIVAMIFLSRQIR